MLILMAAMCLLLAPVLANLFDSHDPLLGPHAHYTESTLCVLAAAVTAGLWINRAAVSRLASLARQRFAFVLVPLIRLADNLNPFADLTSASPPGPLRV